MMAIACYSSSAAGLDAYIGLGEWSYDAKGNPYADGFVITVRTNGLCTIEGDGVTNRFKFPV